MGNEFGPPISVILSYRSSHLSHFRLFMFIHFMAERLAGIQCWRWGKYYSHSCHVGWIEICKYSLHLSNTFNDVELISVFIPSCFQVERFFRRRVLYKCDMKWYKLISYRIYTFLTLRAPYSYLQNRLQLRQTVCLIPGAADRSSSMNWNSFHLVNIILHWFFSRDSFWSENNGWIPEVGLCIY